MDKLLEKLREKFTREELEFRVGAVNKDKMEGLALAYVQARAIQNRLDELFGIDGWTVSYREVSAGFIC
ncbi:Rad52/Rad22 family DNA repair protein, partial [Fusobacterium perfoetens]|uniref:Rad52/Rad22 family DNA repair protein n=1 Tax=Fusobacterium perfoetens TaxID=852 RepID=UPI0026F353B1